MEFQNKTTITGPSLRTMLLPLMVALFIWEEPGIPRLLDYLGLPSNTWIIETWNYLWMQPYPAYATRFTDIFGLIGVMGGFLLFWFDDQNVEQLQLTKGMLGLVRGDTTAIISISLFSVGSAIIVNYPLALVPILHGMIIVFLYFVFVRIHTLVPSVLGLPKETTKWSTKFFVFGTILFLCGIATVAAVVLMQTAQYCTMTGCLP